MQIEKAEIKLKLTKLKFLLRLFKNDVLSKLVYRLMQHTKNNNNNKTRGLLKDVADITDESVIENDKLYKTVTTKIYEIKKIQSELENSEEVQEIRDLLMNRNEENEKKLNTLVMALKMKTKDQLYNEKHRADCYIIL